MVVTVFIITFPRIFAVTFAKASPIPCTIFISKEMIKKIIILVYGIANFKSRSLNGNITNK